MISVKFERHRVRLDLNSNLRPLEYVKSVLLLKFSTIFEV